MLILSIVSVCRVDVVSLKSAMELFMEAMERKMYEGKNNTKKKNRGYKAQQ